MQSEQCAAKFENLKEVGDLNAFFQMLLQSILGSINPVYSIVHSSIRRSPISLASLRVYMHSYATAAASVNELGVSSSCGRASAVIQSMRVCLLCSAAAASRRV